MTAFYQKPADRKSFRAACGHNFWLRADCVCAIETGFSPERNQTDFFMHLLETIENEQKKTDVPSFKVGDSVRVHTKVIEGDKERVQIFTGIVIGRKGTGVNENFTVRRISYGEGVERVFPIHSPRIAKIEVEKAGTARRAKLNYLRGRKGKQAMAVREAK